MEICAKPVNVFSSKGSLLSQEFCNNKVQLKKSFKSIQNQCNLPGGRQHFSFLLAPVLIFVN